MLLSFDDGEITEIEVVLADKKNNSSDLNIGGITSVVLLFFTPYYATI